MKQHEKVYQYASSAIRLTEDVECGLELLLDKLSVHDMNKVSEMLWLLRNAKENMEKIQEMT